MPPQRNKLISFMKSSLRTLTIVLLLLLVHAQSYAQDKIREPENKGKMYILWGWNWGYYSDSDIHFQGADYDFVLDDVVGVDRQSEFDLDVYFKS